MRVCVCVFSQRCDFYISISFPIPKSFILSHSFGLNRFLSLYVFGPESVFVRCICICMCVFFLACLFSPFRMSRFSILLFSIKFLIHKSVIHVYNFQLPIQSYHHFIQTFSVEKRIRNHKRITNSFSLLWYKFKNIINKNSEKIWPQFYHISMYYYYWRHKTGTKLFVNESEILCSEKLLNENGIT